MNTRGMIIMLAAATAIIASSITAGQTKRQAAGRAADTSALPHVTFVELGSVKCIPCRMMQPVMKAVERKYGSQVRVVFHDVWTKEGKPQAEKYDIRLIPTQVFLDAQGKEFFRHEGFYPEAAIDTLLQKRGLKVLIPGG